MELQPKQNLWNRQNDFFYIIRVIHLVLNQLKAAFDDKVITMNTTYSKFRVTSIYQNKPIAFIAVILSFWMLNHCASASVREKNEAGTLNLTFSHGIRKHLVMAEKETYTEEEIPLILDRFRNASSEVCKMVHKKIKYNSEKVYQYINKDSFSAPPFKTWDTPLPKLIAGCWNFFKLNDIRPDIDFKLVSKLYPAHKKECFSVGFMQPYIMHAVLGCEKVVMLDIDWRIMDGHYQLLTQFKNKAMTDKSMIDASIPKLKIGWIARFDNKPMEESVVPAMDHICFKHRQKECYEYLSTFQNTFSLVKEFELQVSHLHGSKFNFIKERMPVIFLSNAIEDLYTSRDQFMELMDRTANALPAGSSALFIHHTAGRPQFGIYELVKKVDSFEILTICKDPYMSSPVGEAYPYRTHFEKITKTKNPPQCSNHPLLKE